MAAVDRAVELEPDLPDRHIQRARCYVLVGDTDQAKVSAEIALQHDIQRLDHLLILGGVLVRCGEQQAALQVFLKAKETSNDSADVHRGLASVYRFLGQLGEAEVSCEAAIRLDPHDYEMIGLRSSLRTQSSRNNHIKSLTDLERSGLKNWRGVVHVAFSLAKEYEDIGEYQESFKWLNHGASTKRRNTKYDLEDDLKIFGALTRTFSADVIAKYQGTGTTSKEAIFVLGMPRTGSTLVERIISSHSMVQSAGELSVFSVEMMKLVEELATGQKVDRLKLAEFASQIDMRRLGERYLEVVARGRDGSARFVDKLPLNSLNIGLIHAALPNAKIVHVVRNPMDACYAMYKFLFKNGYPFSYDLEELAAYYTEYYRLMEHWRRVLPEGKIYDIVYEDVVDDLPGQAAKLIDYLGLPWEASCKEFYRNEQSATTGSASQVRRPVYRSSVGKWRYFEKELLPLKNAFEKAGIPID
jgi:tetratricopeptide (TPR) repeat protein